MSVLCLLPYHCTPCNMDFTKKLSLQQVINRYQESDPPESKEQLFEHLSTNDFLGMILSVLNEENAKFFFKILPSGSLREGFGKRLPSTSVLATDYDLMLVPDAIHAQEMVETERISAYGKNLRTTPGKKKQNEAFVSIMVESDENSDDSNDDRNNAYEQDNVEDVLDEPPLFHIITDPREDPETPSGFLWLKLVNYRMTQWGRLCFPRQYQGQGKSLSFSYFEYLINWETSL